MSSVSDRYTIISADCHAGASHDMYREYLDPAYLADFDACDMVDRETYRLLHLLGCYLVLRSQKPDLYDAGLESLEVIRKAGFLREYVIFDRIAPYTQYARTATLTAEGRSQLREYVLRFGISGGNGGPGIK